MARLVFPDAVGPIRQMAGVRAPFVDDETMGVKEDEAGISEQLEKVQGPQDIRSGKQR